MKKIIIGLLACVLFTSCATYIATTQNLQKALEKGKPQIGVTQIKTTDQNGNEVVLSATLHTGIRITQKDDSRQTFYLITASLKDSTIVGSKSAIFDIPIKPIKLTDIKLIELDGR